MINVKFQFTIREIISAALLLIIILGTYLITIQPTEDAIYACSDAASCQKEADTAKAKRAELEAKQAEIESKTTKLEDEVENINQLISTYIAEITATDVAIAQLQNESTKLEQGMKETEEKLKKRLVDTQLSFETNETLEFIANANSITEMIERSQVVSTLSEEDTSMIDKYDAQNKRAIENKQEQEVKKEELVTLKKEQQEFASEKQVKIEQYNKEAKNLEFDAAQASKSVASAEDQKNAFVQAQKEAEAAKAKAAAEAAKAEAAKAEAAKTQNTSGSTESSGSSSTTSSSSSGSTASSDSTAVATNSADFVLPTAFGGSTCFTDCYSGHNGVDIAGHQYTNNTAFAFYDMVVLSASGDGSYNGGYGNNVQVAFQYNGTWYTSIYAHLSAVNVSAGQYITKGQKIGIVGTTGNSTGIHLHLEIHEAVMSGGSPIFQYTNVGDPRLKDPRIFLGLPYSWNNL